MFKKRLLKPVLGVALSCALLVPALAVPVMASSYPLEPDDPVITGALDYLASVQAPDGSIGSYGDSAWAVMAIAAAEEDPDEFGSPSVVDYIKYNAANLGSEWNWGTAYARVILAIVAACEDPSAFGPGDPVYAPGGDYLSELKGLHNGTQFTDQWGTTNTLNDDIWGLLALIAAGEPQDSPMVTSTAAFIKGYQGEDGGWSWATFENPWYWESDVDDTAAGIMALIAAGEPQDSPVIEDALFYLQDNQDASGGFLAWGAANLASTTWAVDAIVAAGGDPTSAEWAPAGNDPIDYIMTFKKADGSFLDGSAWSPNPQKNTADATVSLLGKPYPVIPTCPLSVSIDIRPGTFPNDINLRSQGRIPVAILTTGCFDAATVDASTVCFGPAGAAAVHHALKDVDSDGDIDMILHFEIQATGISAGDTEATLTGATLDGGKIVGTDSVSTVPN